MVQAFLDMIDMACNGLENVKKGKLFPQRSQGFISFTLPSEMPHCTASLLERAQVPCSWLLSLLPGLFEFGSAKLAGWGSQLVSWAGSVAAQRRIFHTLLQNKCKKSSHHHVAKTDATLIPCTRCDAGHSFLARGSRVKAFQTSRKGIGTS